MPQFFTEKEKNLTKEYEQNGYIIKNLDHSQKKKLLKIRDMYFNFSKKVCKFRSKNKSYVLNNFHEFAPVKNLNKIRLNIIKESNNNNEILRKLYYEVARDYLEILLGNELVMQKRINLSIQMPNDDSSLLPVHSDVWSGDSPYELVVWIPLVDCYKSKSMYILDPKSYNKFYSRTSNKKISKSENIFKFINKKVQWLNIKFGQVLLFNQCLPHGNIVNIEKETRWSLNCRFKSVFSPYQDKRIGEFFEPITLRAVSSYGMNYEFPKFKV
jgi:sporadic carbohydrate cluster 2OG-Fe(II) oxygenase|tara:strand:- start:548 stop:1357 length:810 start_codon:yes stop_codon:yes gene_type:complete